MILFELLFNHLFDVGTASEATVTTLLSARTKMIAQEQSRDPKLTKHEITQRLVAYASKCSHSSAERAGTAIVFNIKVLLTKFLVAVLKVFEVSNKIFSSILLISYFWLFLIQFVLKFCIIQV